MRVLFACGGSAGHINPALATADALAAFAPRPVVAFIGSGRRMERKLIPEAGYELHDVPSRGLERGIKLRNIKHNFTATRLMLRATRRAGEIIDAFKPDIIVGTGGYVCYPVIRAADRRGIPCVIHESNAAPGLTTRLVSKLVKRVYTAFPDSAALYRHAKSVVVAPTPVRAAFTRVTRESARRELGIGADEKLVVSFFGSLGAARMNDAIRGVIERNARDRDFRHIHAVGGGDERYREFTFGLLTADNLDVRAYIDDMPRVMAAADLIICRAGASTLAELTCLGRASVLIPSPYVTGDHQTVNARAMETAGASVMLREADCNGETLYDTVKTLLSGGKIAEMEQAARKLGSRDAADRFALELYELASPSGK
ncbi:MAG: undecaprenyldiphospho-muramoylpentapeptide beta-N-acetylglucosaminyltransferase [Oscillospiraceae bacterium]|jgi:UDP-N-acetylglucosamine--N-acetylmuramyl-(pentapeptide) pyrophosphoryl-undecaprenol N-acetylglucosamine transferase|nr:undecaprenyldiphospho-muramoylpentapeptide beta-N-acetylglucosaminyltransferase [Oscillospiraceae bacterium]